MTGAPVLGLNNPAATSPTRRGMRERTANERRWMYVRACALLKHGYRRPLTLPAVAAILAISPRQLQRVFEQFGSRTFREELLWRRMTAAAELLACPALPLAEVSALVGYSGGSHFTRTFRRCYGVSPSAYRRAVRVQQARC
jgi:AraC-like DNA-binding protein